MASADEDFPRGWTISTRPATGTQASVAALAFPGITRVLTEVAVSITSGAGAVAADVVIEVLSAAQSFFTLAGNNPLLEIASAIVTTGTIVTGIWNGKISGYQGQDITVRFNAGVTGWAEVITIQGYDI